MKATEILTQIKEVLGLELTEQKVELATANLDNGTAIEAEAFEAGNEVFIVGEGDEENSKIPMPIGKYTMEDGKILTVSEEGLIDSIDEAGEDAPAEEEEEEEEVEATDESKVTKERTTTEVIYASKEELDELKAKLEQIATLLEKQAEDVEEKVEDVEMSAEIVEPIAHNPEAVSEEPIIDYHPSAHAKLVHEIINNFNN